VLIGLLTNIAIVNPYFIVLMVILAFCYYGVTNVYLKTSRNVKRLEGTSK
jgi:F0F1-type ATP synthase assembly protein I